MLCGDRLRQFGRRLLAFLGDAWQLGVEGFPGRRARLAAARPGPAPGRWWRVRASIAPAHRPVLRGCGGKRRASDTHCARRWSSASRLAGSWSVWRCVLVQVVHRVLHLGQRGFQRGDAVCKRGLDVGLRLQRRQRTVDQRCGIGFFIVQRGDGGLRGVQQALRVGQAAVLGVQFFPLARQGSELVELGDLPGQAFAFLLQRVLFFGGVVQRLALVAPVAPGEGGWPGVDAGVGVEQVAHGFGPGEALPGVLAVDVDQTVGQGLELGHGGGAAVDPGAAAAFGVHGAAQQQAVFDRETVFLQPGRHARRVRRIRRRFRSARRLRAPHRSRLARPAPAAVRRSGWICPHRFRR